jgi:hypothetical protein
VHSSRRRPAICVPASRRLMRSWVISYARKIR